MSREIVPNRPFEDIKASVMHAVANGRPTQLLADMLALVFYAESGGPLSDLLGPGWRWQVIDTTKGPTTTGEPRAEEITPRHVVWNPRTGAEGQGATLAEAVRAIPIEKRDARTRG